MSFLINLVLIAVPFIGVYQLILAFKDFIDKQEITQFFMEKIKNAIYIFSFIALISFFAGYTGILLLSIIIACAFLFFYMKDKFFE